MTKNILLLTLLNSFGLYTLYSQPNSDCCQKPDTITLWESLIDQEIAASNPRSCVNATQFDQTSLPITITSPGEYCINGNLSINSTMVNGIVINSGNVILNLNNSIINGIGGANGIVVNGQSNVTIRNGTISNMTQSGILINGITQLLTIDSVTTFSNLIGITALGITQAVISNCTSQLSKGSGFAFTQAAGFVNQNCILKNCTSLNNIGQGFSFNSCFSFQVSNCTANNNRSNGFLQFNGDKIFYTECIADNNILNGFSSAGTSNLFNFCVAAGNTLTGFLLLGTKADINNCEANSNGEGFQINNTNHSVLQSISKNNITNGFNATANSSLCQMRNNTSIANNVGYLNNGTTNTFYSNFASANVTDYTGIANFFVSPTVASPINFTANIAE